MSTPKQASRDPLGTVHELFVLAMVVLTSSILVALFDPQPVTSVQKVLPVP
jgi:hypothetical protein